MSGFIFTGSSLAVYYQKVPSKNFLGYNYMKDLWAVHSWVHLPFNKIHYWNADVIMELMHVFYALRSCLN